MKILLSDDSKTIRMILKSLLSELGITDIQEASNGREALDYLTAGQYDVILLDIHMPQMDGLEVLQAIKTNPESVHRETPVVIISSDTDYRQIEKARSFKAFGYIKKPFKKEGLEAAIAAARKIAARRTAEREAAAAPAPAPVAAASAAPAPAAAAVKPDAPAARPAAAKPEPVAETAGAGKSGGKGGVFGWLKRILQTN